MNTKQQRQTRVIELAETHNIALSLKRIMNQGGGYDSERWRRALYHALGIAKAPTEMQRKIREALGLP